jgi:hypothetical protein
MVRLPDPRTATVRVAIQLPERQYDQLSRFATDHQLSISAAVRTAVERLVQPDDESALK